ncbi:hypothetical protein JG688_00013703 [Phytophthora aleatoria]|uniref:Uncharacterized protein n=1 Tax=Phytophthora aleatoria TaxID=2496075 RepID=A0A8J5MEA4_9STRA|nr:hypothetical protein JG688_00013703 [Phytophthora aleatoria]
MEFLYDTKRVSRGAFDEAMMDVATYSWVEEAMAFLCSKRCASRRAVNSAFMPTRSFSMVKNLYETYRDSKQAIIGAFKNAGHIDGFYDKTRARIVELLYEEVCLSPEVIGEALVVAARHGRIEVVELLLDDPRIRAGAICDAFVEAAGQKSNELMIFLCSEEQISADTIWSAFLKAVYSDQLGDGRQNVLQLVGKINFGCCTRSMRKEMLEVARTDAAKKFGQDIL